MVRQLSRFVALFLATTALTACAQLLGIQPDPATSAQPAEPPAQFIVQTASLLPAAAITYDRPAFPHPRPKAQVPLRSLSPAYRSIGVASWYGPGFHGRLTASGEVYDMNAMTAAHRTLPFGTEVLVTNLANNTTLNLVINDRGPFVGQRVIDVSREAAYQLGFLNNGLTEVRIVAIE